MPFLRPSWYHKPSARTAATVANARQNQKLMWPRPANAPAARRKGVAGKGSPTCSAKTRVGSTTYPCRNKNSRLPCTLPSDSPVIACPGLPCLFYEFCSMPPLTAHDKFADWLAVAGSFLSSLIRLGQRGCIPRVTDCHRGNGLPALWNVVCLFRSFRIEASHLVHDEAPGRRFERKLHASPADIILSVSVGSIVFGERQFRDCNRQYRGMFRPVRIKFHQRTERLLEIFTVVTRRDNVRPRLLVVAGRRPSRRFKQASQHFRRDRLVAECPWAPSILNQVLDWIIYWRWFIHCRPQKNRLRYFAACLTISRSMVMVTVSPTTTPPPSMFAFHLTPKSWRFTFVVALAAARVFPQGSFTAALGPSTSSTTSFVTPCMVRSPVILSLPAPADSTFLDLKVRVGNFSTSKKFALRRS